MALFGDNLADNRDLLIQSGTGAMSGAALGASIGAIGGPIGAGGGALIGAGLAYFQSSSASRARRDAEKSAIRARKQSTLQEMGARQQAENIAMGGLIRQPSGQKTNNVLSSQGFIGQNLPTNAGTF